MDKCPWRTFDKLNYLNYFYAGRVYASKDIVFLKPGKPNEVKNSRTFLFNLSNCRMPLVIGSNVSLRRT